jgi:hypothetical protein
MPKRQRSRREKEGLSRLEGEERRLERDCVCLSYLNSSLPTTGKQADRQKGEMALKTPAKEGDRRERASTPLKALSRLRIFLLSTFAAPASPSIPHHHTPIA